MIAPPVTVETMLTDSDVTEVLVNGTRAYVERAGRLHPAGAVDPDAVLHFVERIITPLGLRLDRRSPLVDARLPDGSRLHAAIPPVALDGVQVCIRRFRTEPFTLEDFGLDAPAASHLRAAVAERSTIMIAGGTSSGKTSLLNALTGYLPAGERVVTIEETAELRLAADHVVRLEARPDNAEGVGAVTVRELLRSALRMRPDRLVIGEVRGGEAFDLVQALHTGHAGSLGTVHANPGVDAVERIVHLALLAGVGLDAATLHRQVVAALDVIVHLERTPSGGRRVREIVGLRATSPEVLWHRPEDRPNGEAAGG